MFIDVRRISPAWFRVVFLATLAAPFFNYNIIVMASAPVGTYHFYLAWLLYSLLIYAVMISSVGIRECLAWVGFASVLALVTVGTAATFFYLASVLGFTFESAPGVPYSQAEWSRDLLKKGLAIMSTLPFSLFCVNSFSAAGLAERLGGWHAKSGSFTPHMVIALRTIQHMTEVIPDLMPVWREEHPAVWQPRYQEDVGKHWPIRIIRRVQWGVEATWRWAAAILVYALEPLPIYSHMVESHFRKQPQQTRKT